jgi:hypothetical protein
MFHFAGRHVLTLGFFFPSYLIILYSLSSSSPLWRSVRINAPSRTINPRRHTDLPPAPPASLLPPITLLLPALHMSTATRPPTATVPSLFLPTNSVSFSRPPLAQLPPRPQILNLSLSRLTPPRARPLPQPPPSPPASKLNKPGSP